ncbi:MAG: type III pantothenate kinase [Spirochaetales bacterium]|nr:type III pantothenate kinase [Spirochaetales bacterium]
MLLAFDVGNSNIKIGLCREKTWVQRWQIRTQKNTTADEYCVVMRNLLSQSAIDPGDVGFTIISSVVPPATGSLSEMLVSIFGKEPLIVGPGIKTGIRIRTDNPAEVGSDLVVGAVAAYQRYRSGCVIVGFGTALTFTAVAEPGDLLGVAIAPGLNYASEALFEHTAQLRLVDLSIPQTAIGKNTVHSIQSGILFGYVGIVESIIRRFRSEMPGPAEVIGTGGQAGIIAPLTDVFTEIDPWLNLEGLRLIGERNR